MVTAFLWEKDLQVASKRRMDSEQALWARKWLLKHTRPEGWHPGWTYVFEAVYRTNWVVVPHPFDACVLLSVVDEHGHEASLELRKTEAQRLGVTIAPAVVATVGAFRQLMRRQVGEGVPMRAEGWVLQLMDGGGRVKLVDPRWQQFSRAAKLCHPLHIFEAIRLGRLDGLLGLMAPHHRLEAERMAVAIQMEFERVRVWLLGLLNAHRRRLSSRHEDEDQVPLLLLKRCVQCGGAYPEARLDDNQRCMVRCCERKTGCATIKERKKDRRFAGAFRGSVISQHIGMCTHTLHIIYTYICIEIK
jgi:hypothetical protein